MRRRQVEYDSCHKDTNATRSYHMIFRRGRGSHHRVLCVFLAVVLACCVSVYGLLSLSFSSRFTSVDSVFGSSNCPELLRPVGGGVGIEDEPPESTIMLLFNTLTPSPRRGNTGSAHSGPPQLSADDDETIDGLFAQAASAFVASERDSNSSYYEFFNRHDATAWHVGADGFTMPLTMDVVYTYVNPLSTSYSEARARRNMDTDAARRFRDWGELRYSLRSLYAYAIQSESLRQYHGSGGKKDAELLRRMGYTVSPNYTTVPSAVPQSLIGNVYIVVAHMDQVPSWINTTAFPGLKFVTHAELYSQAEGVDALPNFSSLSIESVVHRIPGLSRFYIYLNNDMLIGRRISLFDLFRPISPPRQKLRMQLTPLLDRRALLFFESVIHSDGWVPAGEVIDSHSAESAKRDSPCGAAVRQRCETQQAERVAASKCLGALHAATTTTTNNNSPAMAIRTTPFMLAIKPWRDPLDVLPNHASLLTTERLDGVLPTYVYAHMPSLFDTFVVEAMHAEAPNGFRAELASVRRSFTRKQNSFSIVHLYPGFLLALRRARERFLWKGQTTKYNDDMNKNNPFYQQDNNMSFVMPDLSWSSIDILSSVERMCALCGDSNAVRLQHPRLYDHLSVWWPSRDGRASPTARFESTRLTASDRGLLSHATELYAGVDAADHDRYRALYSDVLHHTLTTTFRLFMIQDRLRLALSIAAISRANALGTPYLFVTCNDDFAESISTEETDDLGELFHRLLNASVNGALPAPWEVS